MTAPARSLDWVHQRLPSLLVWKLPVVLLAATALLDLAGPVRGLVWAAAFTTMGLGCVRNAMRCGRLHCYLTGPFFLLLATASLLHGFADATLGPGGWSWIGGTALVGGVVLTLLPERLWGRYVLARDARGHH